MDILEALAPLHHVCQVCNLTQWRLLRREDGADLHLQRSRWLELYGWITLSVATIYSAYGIFNADDYIYPESSDIGRTVDHIQLIGIRVAHAGVLLETLWQRRVQMDFYAELREIDRSFLGALNMDVQNRRFQRQMAVRAFVMLGAYLLSQCFILATKLVAPTAVFPRYLYWLSYLLPLLVCGLRYFQIYTAILVVQQRLELLVDMLGSLCLCTSERVNKNVNCIIDGNLHSMRKMLVTRQLYQRIWTLVGLLNRCFGLSMLLQLGNDFLAITSNCYWIFLNFKQFAASPYDFLQIMGSAVWCAPHLANVLVLALLCERAAHCTTRLALGLHRIAIDLENECHNALITQFSLQLLHQRLNFSAAGFFNVDCTLLYTIVGATTTYLIILIQFHMSEISFDNNAR